MALNRVVELRLSDAKLIDLFESEKALWKQMAERAYKYASEYIKQSGKNAHVRQDDVIPALRMELEVTPKLRAALASPSMRQKYWYEYFAALIVDRLWNDLHKEGG